MKPRILIKTGLCAIAFLAALSGCGGGGSSSSTALPEAVATTLKVVVQDEMASPVAAARIRIAGADVTTDATGAVTATLPNSDTATVVLITKSGFATNAKTAVIYSGKASELRVTLFAHQNVSTFAANAGITVAPGGAKVQIPAAAGFRTAAGVAYTGNVTISSSYFNPETLRGVQGFAAPYVGSDAGVQSSLVSLGVIEAKFTAADGSALEMTNAAAATLTYPATSNSGGLATVPLWYYDEAAKNWVREGQAQRAADGSYVGTVTHFTSWNLDWKGVNPGKINVCFRNAQNQPVSPVFASVSGIGWTGPGILNNVSRDGTFEIINAPVGVALELRGTDPVFAAISIAPLAPNEVRNLPCIVLAGPATTFAQTPVTSLPFVVAPTTPIATPTTPGVTATTPIIIPTTPTVTPTSPTVTPTTPIATPTTPSTTASFAGNYVGTYTGAEVGTFNVVVSSAGIVTGNVFSQTFAGQVFPVSGQVGSNGQVVLTATGQAGSSNFVGSISAGGIVSGTWSYNAPLTGGGTFTGQRQISSTNVALLAQYVGTWRTTCEALIQGSTDIIFTIATAGSIGAPSTQIIRYYASANCSGNTVATISDSQISIAATGTKSIGAQSVVKIDGTFVGVPTVTGSASFVSATAGGGSVDVSINGVVVDSQGYFLTALTFKTIFSQPGTGNTFSQGFYTNAITGALVPTDAQGYPQALDPSSLATRQ